MCRGRPTYARTEPHADVLLAKPRQAEFCVVPFSGAAGGIICKHALPTTPRGEQHKCCAECIVARERVQGAKRDSGAC